MGEAVLGHRPHAAVLRYCAICHPPEPAGCERVPPEQLSGRPTSYDAGSGTGSPCRHVVPVLPTVAQIDP
jgi:hypothetical protein